MTDEKKLGDTFTVDVTPTWTGLMPAFIHIIESGDEEGRKLVGKELYRMAKLLDEARALLEAKENDDG